MLRAPFSFPGHSSALGRDDAGLTFWSMTTESYGGGGAAMVFAPTLARVCSPLLSSGDGARVSLFHLAPLSDEEKILHQREEEMRVSLCRNRQCVRGIHDERQASALRRGKETSAGGTSFSNWANMVMVTTAD